VTLYNTKTSHYNTNIFETLNYFYILCTEQDLKKTFLPKIACKNTNKIILHVYFYLNILNKSMSISPYKSLKTLIFSFNY
jgi:hypothetical protein